MAEAPQERAASKRTRTRILAGGRRIVARGGLRSLTVRGVAAQTKVNLGTFVYHFGTREDFANELMESWYAPIYARLLDLAVDEASPPLERVRRYLLQLAAFLTGNRRFVRNLLIDAAGGEQAAVRFLKSLLGRHPLLLFRLIGEAQQAGALCAGDPLKMGVFLFGATLFPTVWLGVLLPDGLLSSDAQPLLRETLFAPAEIEQRIDWALQGLAAPQPARIKNDQGRAMNVPRRKSRSKAQP
jgi:AcrR family transcriptional regulator